MTRYVILWWVDQTPYGALFDDELQADSAARVRNAIYIELPDGKDLPVILDYYRRDSEGKPLPIRWRNLSPSHPYSPGTGIGALM